jgi:HK97 family phage portal protein
MALKDSIRKTINNFLGNKPRTTLATLSIGAPEVFNSIDSDKAINKGYNGNTSVYSLINKDARKFASIKTYLKGKDEEVIENELSKLLNRPNEFQGSDAFRATLRSYYTLTGECFIWLNRGYLADDYIDENGNTVSLDSEKRKLIPVLEMVVIPSDHVVLIPDPNNIWGILGYKLIIGGNRLHLQKEDVVHWKNVSLEFDAVLRTHLRGHSPLSAGYKTLQQNNDATDASVRMYQNDGAKGLLYNETLDRLTPEQRTQINSVIDRKINSSEIKGAVATLQGKWSYIDLGKSNTDLGLIEGKNQSLKELCFLFDVPYELFDSETTFANKREAQRGWVYNSIIPACKQYDDELNRTLLKAFNLEGVCVIESDFDDMEEMREDVAHLVTSLNAAWWIDPNEKREWMGFDSKGSEFDEVFIPTGIQPLSMLGQSIDSISKQLQDQGLND